MFALQVLADPATTTRISGTVLNTDGEPLVGVPVELGRLQALTGVDGTFMIELSVLDFPTDDFDILVPAGDVHFDPLGTGSKTIDLKRSRFDRSTGTDPTNPRQHPNLVSGFIDGSVVYGSDAGRASALRTADGTGKLKTSPGDLLPLNNPTYFP